MSYWAVYLAGAAVLCVALVGSRATLAQAGLFLGAYVVLLPLPWERGDE